MTFEEVVAHFPGGRLRNDREYDVKCPAHDDRRASLGIGRGDNGGVVVKCQAGCDTEDVLAQHGLRLADLAPPRANGHAPHGETVYVYYDEQGEPIREVVRTADKRFWQRKPGAKTGGVGDARNVLFQLPQLLKTESDSTIFIVEGEKDCWRLWKLGLPATTNPGGAGKWLQEHTEWLKEHLPDRRFVILPDNDPPGIKHADEIEPSLKQAGLDVRTVLLPGLPPKGDVSDWLGVGKTKEDLLEAIRPAPSKMAAQVISAPKLLTTELPPADWIVPGIIAQRMVQLIAGREKTGKSVLVETLCLSAASGGRWLGETCLLTRTLYINWEDPLQITQGRIRRHLSPGELPPEDYCIYPPPYTTSIWDLLPDLRQLIIEERFGLVVIDPIARAAKWRDENDASETAVVFEALQELADETGCSFVPVHHANKSEGQFADAMRGSTAIPAGVIGFSILRRTKERKEFEFETIHKLSMGEDLTRILTRDYRTMTWQVLRVIDHNEDGERGGAESQAFEDLQECLLLLGRIGDLSGVDGVTQQELETATGWSHSRVSRRLLRLVARGQLIKEQPEATGKHRPAARYWVHPKANERELV